MLYLEEINERNWINDIFDNIILIKKWSLQIVRLGSVKIKMYLSHNYLSRMKQTYFQNNITFIWIKKEGQLKHFLGSRKLFFDWEPMYIFLWFRHFLWLKKGPSTGKDFFQKMIGTLRKQFLWIKETFLWYTAKEKISLN